MPAYAPAPLVAKHLTQGHPVSPLGTSIRLARGADAAAITALSNLAFTDSHWFKRPHFYDRTNLDEVLAGILDPTIDLDAPLNDHSCFLVLDWPAHLPDGTPLPQPDGETATFGAQGVPLAVCVQVHKDYDSAGAPMMGMLSVHPLLHRRGLAKWTTDAVERLVTHVLHGHRLLIEVVSLQTYLFTIYEKLGFVRLGDRGWEKYGVYDWERDMTRPSTLVLMEKRLTPVATVEVEEEVEEVMESEDDESGDDSGVGTESLIDDEVERAVAVHGEA
ncbi:hypothetical protein GGF31_006805 [Allomyces arbusculus]|nr:hypothetical protein GGF31_006805 [Allomyces arbusculus]